jgi:hypothetical protein
VVELAIDDVPHAAVLRVIELLGRRGGCARTCRGGHARGTPATEISTNALAGPGRPATVTAVRAGVGRALAAVALGGALAACTQAVPGTPLAVGEPVPTGQSSPAPSSPAPTGPPAGRSGLTADVVVDECLLDAEQFGTLLGRPVLEPEQLDTPRSDGSTGSSCYVHSAEGYPTPLAAVNVYLPRSGTPTEFVRNGPTGGRRDLAGLGEAAALYDTATGLTLQVASPRYVVTIAVLEGEPPEEEWRTAATAALAALP